MGCGSVALTLGMALLAGFYDARGDSVRLADKIDSLGEIAAVSLVRNDFVPELAMELEEPVQSGQLIINFRAEAAPETLATIVREALSAATAAFAGSRAKLEHLENFRPGRPTPTYRLRGTSSSA